MAEYQAASDLIGSRTGTGPRPYQVSEEAERGYGP